jgi:hypothetical protein
VRDGRLHGKAFEELFVWKAWHVPWARFDFMIPLCFAVRITIMLNQSF